MTDIVFILTKNPKTSSNGNKFDKVIFMKYRRENWLANSIVHNWNKLNKYTIEGQDDQEFENGGTKEEER